MLHQSIDVIHLLLRVHFVLERTHLGTLGRLLFHFRVELLKNTSIRTMTKCIKCLHFDIQVHIVASSLQETLSPAMGCLVMTTLAIALTKGHQSLASW